MLAGRSPGLGGSSIPQTQSSQKSLGEALVRHGKARCARTSSDSTGKERDADDLAIDLGRDVRGSKNMWPCRVGMRAERREKIELGLREVEGEAVKENA